MIISQVCGIGVLTAVRFNQEAVHSRDCTRLEAVGRGGDGDGELDVAVGWSA